MVRIQKALVSLLLLVASSSKICVKARKAIPLDGIRCWTCENADSIEDCDLHGELKSCNPNQNVCGTEIRHNGDWQISNSIKIFKFCKERHACGNVQNQNDRDDWEETQCNPVFPNSVCRCCCDDEDGCNYGGLKCLDINVVEPHHCFPNQLSPSNGKVLCSNESNVGSLCTFSCNQGFYVKGAQISMCQPKQAGARWTAPPPTCALSMCHRIPDLIYGSIECTKGASYGSRCQFTCNQGYRLVGEQSSVCDQTKRNSQYGKWSTFGQYCKKISCQEKLPAPQYGSVSCTDYNNAGSDCHFSCGDEFKLIGPKSVSCVDNGITTTWSEEAPSCQRKQCSSMPVAPQDGKVICSNMNFLGSVCYFGCSIDRNLNGREKITCVENPLTVGVEWDGIPAKCIRKQCSAAPVAPSFGSVSCTDGSFFGSVCTFSCNDEYYQRGASTTTCGISGRDSNAQPEWTQINVYCLKKNCLKQLEPPSYGTMECTNAMVLGSVCKFKCNPNYYLDGAETSKCTEDGINAIPVWDNEAPSCKPKRCGVLLKSPDNGDVVCSNMDLLGSTCQYTCDKEFYLDGLQITTCIEDVDILKVYWDNEPPVCKRKECGPTPTAPLNGKIQCSDSSFLRSTCFFSCNFQYNLDGPERTTCVEIPETGDLQWNRSPPKCARKQCTDMPTIPEFGSMQCSNAAFYGSLCTFTCDDGLKIDGSLTTSCGFFGTDDNGQPTWSHKSPICQKMQCSTIEIPQNGEVVCSNGNSVRSKCEFACDPHYKLIGAPSSTCTERSSSTVAWSDDSPICKRISCPQLKELQNGKVACSNQQFVNSECKFTCTTKDYQLFPENVHSITCRDNSTWSAQMPCCERPCPKFAVMDLIVVLDSSSSIGLRNWRTMLDLFTVQVDAMNFGVVRYNRKVDIENQVYLKEYPEDVELLKELVSSLPYDGQGTWTGQAMTHVLKKMLLPERGDRDYAPDVLLVLTDGRSQDDVSGPAEAIRKSGIMTFSIGINPGTGVLDKDQLLTIAGSPERRFIAEAGFGALTPEFAAHISANICGNPCDR